MANYYLVSISSLGLVIQAGEIAFFIWLQTRGGFDDGKSKWRRLLSTFNILWLVMWMFTVVFSASTLLISLRPESPSQVELLFGIGICSLDAAVIFYAMTILLRAETDVLMVARTPRFLFAAVCATGVRVIALKIADLTTGMTSLRVATAFSVIAIGAVTCVFDTYFVRFFWKEYRRWRTYELTRIGNTMNTSEFPVHSQPVESLTGIVTRYSLAACLCSVFIFVTAVVAYIVRGSSTRDVQEFSLVLNTAPVVLLAMKWRLQNLRRQKSRSSLAAPVK